MNTTLANTLPLAARHIAPALVGLLFAVSGWNKIGGFDHVAGWMASLGLPAAPALLTAAIALELVAGVMLMVGFGTRWAALALAAFTIPTTLIFHAFWNVDAAQFAEQQTAFLKNLAILGALLMVAAQAPAPKRATATAALRMG